MFSVVLDLIHHVVFFCILALNPNVRQNIDEYIRTEMKKQKIPGLSMAIIQNNQLLYGQGYGYANIEHKVPVTLETVFQSGSMGKQFTAMAVMILVERDDIDLDTCLREYIDGTPKAWRSITIRHLLTRTAGTSGYPDDFSYQEDITKEDMFKLIKTIPLDFEPGEKYSYSNLGYIILGILIRQITDEFYGDFLQHNVFEPLGMKTARIITEKDIVPNRAAGYTLEDDEVKHQEWVAPSLNTFADGALYLSIYDMIKWDMGLASKKLLKEKTSFHDMWSPVTLNDGTTCPYGFGWELDETVSGMRVVKHSGTWQGFESMIIRVLDVNVTIAMFANLYEADVDTMSTDVLKMYNSECALKSSDDE